MKRRVQGWSFERYARETRRPAFVHQDAQKMSGGIRVQATGVEVRNAVALGIHASGARIPGQVDTKARPELQNMRRFPVPNGSGAILLF